MKPTKTILLISLIIFILAIFRPLLFAGIIEEKNNAENFKSLSPQINNYTKFSVAKKIPSTEWQKQNTPEFSKHPEYGTMPYNGPEGNWVEQLEKRKENYRYFINPINPSEFTIQKSLGNIHFFKDGFWQTINPKIKDFGNGIYEANMQPEPVGFDSDLKKSYIKTVGGEIEFNKWKLFGKKNNSQIEIADANWLDFTAGDDGIYIKNIFPGIDAEMTAMQGSIKTNFIIKNLLFVEFDYLIFKDSFNNINGTCSLNFKDESIAGNTGSEELLLKLNGQELLEISKAIAYPKGSVEENSFFPLYTINQNFYEINIPVTWIKQHIQNDDIVIDPLVTTTGTMGTGAITGSQYNATCNFTNSCNHNLSVTPPASATITGANSTFNYLTAGACLMNGGAITYGLNSCQSPVAGFVWTCNNPTPGTCTGTNTPLPEFASCFPSPSCNPAPLNFVLRFYRRCVGTAGCNNTCIRAGSPWVITITGQTLNVGSASATGGTSTICVGANANLASTGSNGTPPYTYLWNPGAMVGQNQTVSPASTTVYNVLISDACGSTATQNVTVNVTPNTNPNFTINPNPACVGDAITFTGLGTGNANSYDWLLPSSSSGNLTNQQTISGISYATAGSFNATLNYQQGLCLFPITNQITINDIPPAPIISSNSPLCLGQTLNLDGPSIAGATYNWTGPSFSSAIEDPTINNVVNANSGNYNLTVTVNGCTSNASTLNVVINPLPTQPTITANGALSICNGQNVILTSSASSSYLWSNGATTQSITVSAAGSYTVQVINSQGCSSVLSLPTVITLSSNPPQPAITTSGPTTFCNGNTVTLTSSLENSYLWSNGATTQSITTSLAGTYSVVVTNSSGCSSASSNATNVTVNPGPGIPTISGGPLNFCDGGNVTLSAPPGFSYLWSNGNTAQSIVLSNSENVTVTITDANGCAVSSAPTNVTVNPVPSTPLITASGTTTFCAGNSVVLNSPNGFSYLWSNGATNQSITVNISGVYSLLVTDANGCTSNNSNTISVTVFPIPATPLISASSNSICVGNIITLSASNSASYLWSNGSTSQNITVSTPGNYSLTSTDINGCISASSSVFNLIENPLPPTPIIVASGILNFCDGNSVTLSGPAGFQNYIWNSAVTTNQNNTITASGTYILQVTDANGCTSLESLPIEVTVYPNPSSPIIIANGPLSFCDGGSVQLSVNDLNVSYLWSNGETTQTILVDASGNFSVEIINQQGCISSASTFTSVVEFPISPLPVISTLNGTSICEGTTTNLVCSSAASYIWQPNGETSQSIEVGSAGNYSVSVIDNNGCPSGLSLATTISLLSLPTTPQITANGLTTFCFGNSVELSSSSVINNNWNSGETTQSITVTNSGDFYVTVLGTNGCLSLPSNTIEVEVNSPPPPPAIVANGALTFCNGNSVILTVTNSQSYLWSNGSTVQSQEFNQTEQITVNVLDVCGVPYSLQAQVTVLQQPQVLFDAIDTVGCVPLPSTFFNLSTNYNEVFWDFGDGSSSTEINPFHTYSIAGKYTVSLVAISLEGCLGYYSKNFLIDALAVPIADFKTNPESKIKISKPDVEFIDLSKGNVNRWNWSIGGDIFSELKNSFYQFADTGSYNVKLWIKSNEGCEDTISKNVLINGDLIIYVPNTFSPNNDGVNDIFLPLGTYINPKEYNLKIFNRWGQIVFETNDLLKGWDGDTGTGNVKPTQVYYWQLNVKDFAGESYFLNGSVSVIY